jgi:hypothetical protein
MIEFRKKLHTVRKVEVVEVFVDGQFKGAIYPNNDHTGIRFLSNHFEGEPVYEDDLGLRSWEFVWERH